jgi:conjugal transfer pilus assembly protein TraW
MSKHFFIAAVTLATLVSGAFAKDLGTIGAVYPITEPDALEEIEHKAKSIDWGKLFTPEKNEQRVREYRPAGLVSPPRAKADSIKQVDLTYTLEFEIPDGRGGILYPKGYTFNPLDYIDYQKTIIVLNASDREQVDWFKASPYNGNSTLMITDGSYYDLSRELSRAVYYASPIIIDRFNITAVPSVVSQQKNRLMVKEVCVDCNKK